MNRNRTHTTLATAIAATLGLAAAAPALADDTGNEWQFRVIGYAYVPDIGGAAGFPSGGSANVDITANELVDNANLAGMGAFEFQKGRFGGFVDLIYLDIGDSVDDATSLGQGSVPLPPGITADAALDIEATLVTFGAGYRLRASESTTVDLFAGVRYLDGKATLDWAFSAPFGPFVGPAQAGSSTISDDAIDGIAGVKGRFTFGADREWFVPFYADAGAGDSDLTYQVSTGLGRRFGKAEVIASYRYLRYEFSGDRLIEDLDFSGPAIGLAYRF